MSTVNTFRITNPSGATTEVRSNECETVDQFINVFYGMPPDPSLGLKIELIAIDGQTPPDEEEQDFKAPIKSPPSGPLKAENGKTAKSTAPKAK